MVAPEHVFYGIIITLLVLLISALNTILIASALFNANQAKQRNRKRKNMSNEGRL